MTLADDRNLVQAYVAGQLRHRRDDGMRRADAA